ncbi:molybdenum ABC transporter ATP-binding protein [Oceanimonas doudoroffii]|uniref:Molybdenum ABC transporter ATP-binding protein n=1 Tax=Oceanimonas doudoroffii TaxID=84158 RepID=A0A233RI29_9GAMM|nr:molybdenum ABC transporter ATP-binding protein [Oceanimonas doudoroffii]OXY83034.1 molybdenum ABC transporter ATP-binding protein [Oceanimonas doudoroffii]
MISARFKLVRPGFCLDAAFEQPSTGVTALFGPSGCGKTTLLRCLAGLERADGELWLNGESLHGLPVHRRRFGYVFQEASLFNHLSVRDNLLYGWRRLPKGITRPNVNEVVGWLGLSHLLAQGAASLSGGQRQRVAIGRALLTAPRLLLLDEPLSALDTQAKREILPWIEGLSARAGVPVFYVTHAPDEVERLADRVIFMARGRTTQVEPLQQAMARPDSTLFVEQGAASILEGTLEAELEDGRTPFAFNGQTLWLVHARRQGGERARVRIQASDVSLALAPVAGVSILNQLPLRLVVLHQLGEGRVLVDGKLDGGQRLLAEVSAWSAGQLGLHQGMACYALIKAVALVN